MTRLLCLLLLAAVVCQGHGSPLEEDRNRLEYISKLDPEPEFKCLLDGLHPNPANCSTFIQCSNGIKNIMPCPKGLHYNEEKQQCDVPCNAYCNKTLSCSCKWPTCDKDDVCFLPREIGDCRALIPMYFFNKRTGKCEKFKYGGCGGNENKFRTQQDCEKKCLTSSSRKRDSSSMFSFCGLPSSIGPCNQYETRYYYNLNTDKCETFKYGGCEGNRNNFKTKEACEKECGHDSSENDEDICRLPSQSGSCTGHFPRYFFDHTKGNCEEFVYGGCGGNANNFETMRDCENKCLRRTLNSEDICRLPSKPGPCNGRFPRYFFDYTKGKCVKFIYGGCEGNANNFETVKDCELACLRKSGSSRGRDSSSTFSFCGLPSSVGPCDQYETRYYYNLNTDKCETFEYGGCEGNRNNFKTKEACEKECGHQSSVNSENICRLPSKPGPCRGRFPRYFFDSTKGKCVKFIYGGCSGNANNFETVKDCESACLRTSASTDVHCEEDGTFKNPDNCGSYFNCSGGVRHEVTCLSGMHFSSKTKRCELQCRARCDPSLACECEWEVCGDRGTATIFPEEETIWESSEDKDKIPGRRNCSTSIDCLCGLPSCKQGPHEGPCPRQGQYVKWPFGKTCNTYVKCSSHSILTCPRGMHFNELTRRCDTPCRARCATNDKKLACLCGWPECEKTNSEEDSTCSESGRFKDPEHCDSYFECSDGVKKHATCPQGLHFNEETSDCDSPCDARCDHSLAFRCGWPVYSDYSEESTCTEDGNFPDPEHCGSYIECSNGVEERKMCSPGLHFNEASGNCDSPCEALCDPSLALRCGWPVYSDY